MRWWGTAALAWVLAAGPVGAVELDLAASARSDARARSNLPGDRGEGAAMDVELAPRLSAAVSKGRTRFEVWYSPSLIFRDVSGNNLFVPLHRGRAALGFGLGRALVSLSEDYDWGVTDLVPFRSLDTAPGASPGTVPGTTPGTVPPPVVNPHVATLVPYVRSASRVAIDTPLADLVTLLAEGDYVISGGREGTPVLPLQRGPSASARVGVFLNRNDTLFSTLAGRIASFSTGQEQRLAWLTETWSRRTTEVTTFEVSGGLGATQTKLNTPQGWVLIGAINPVAAAGVTTRLGLWGSPLEGRFRVALGPYADQFTGAVYERLEGQGGFTWTWRSQLVVMLLGGVGTGTTPAGVPLTSDWVATGEVNATWMATRWLLVGAQARGAKSSLFAPGFTDTLWLAGVNVTVLDQEHKAW